jgi:hypothetical protein
VVYYIQNYTTSGAATEFHMTKQLKSKDKRFIGKVESRRSKGWGWKEIAGDLDMPTSTCFQRYYRLIARRDRLERFQSAA